MLGQEPDARVFRYIKRSEIAKIFEQRKRKIIDFTLSAENFADRAQIADALRYYYWALTLLRSHPEGSVLEFPDKTGRQQLLISYLPSRINSLLEGIKFSITEINDQPGHRVVTLWIESNGRPVRNFEYSYWDGRDWSSPVGTKDGVGYLEFFGDMADKRAETRIRAEYIFEGEARIDRELEDVLKKLDPIPFKTAYYNLSFNKSEAKTAVSGNASLGNTTAATQTKSPSYQSGMGSDNAFQTLKLSKVENLSEYDDKVEKILEAIRTNKLEQVKSYFTDEGYKMFQQLIMYGNAKVLGHQSGTAIRFGESVIYRGPKMSFSFQNNKRKFVEDIVFHFEKSGKIASIAFALEQDAVNSIVGNNQWSEVERLTMVTFLEHYKTAYALKRMDYIRSIFADDALIIVGNMVKVKMGDNPFQNNSIIRYNRYNKEQYLRNLQHCFNSNEFINIKFEDSELRKTGSTGRYGIQIKQNYHSSNYGDQGYLFLLIDFSDPNEPVIHVRTWQPEKNPDGSIYGVEDF